MDDLNMTHSFNNFHDGQIDSDIDYDKIIDDNINMSDSNNIHNLTRQIEENLQYNNKNIINNNNDNDNFNNLNNKNSENTNSNIFENLKTYKNIDIFIYVCIFIVLNNSLTINIINNKLKFINNNDVFNLGIRTILFTIILYIIKTYKLFLPLKL
jgi:hypothetical protein